jgi:tryptophan-rich sensory protein
MKIKANYFSIVLLVLVVAAVGSLLTSMGLGWYAGLRLPSIAPAGSFIGLVWTIIFILSAVAIILFWNAPRRKNFQLIVGLFLLNGLLNVGWSLVFFTWHQLWWALPEMLLLNLTNLALIYYLWRYERRSALLLVPYFLWVSFATYLAYRIATLNA